MAVSIAPDRVVGDKPSTQHQVRAATSFSALLNTLFVSLAAQLPGANLATVAIVLAASGASTTVGLFLLLVRERRKGALRPREVLLLLVLLGPYGFQLSAAVRFVRFPHDLTAINEQAALLFGFFAFAVGRDWELLGAETKSRGSKPSEAR